MYMYMHLKINSERLDGIPIIFLNNLPDSWLFLLQLYLRNLILLEKYLMYGDMRYLYQNIRDLFRNSI